MRETLKQESEQLARSWMQHESLMLRDYLVGGVEDPRINFQSVLTRHFLIRGFSGNYFEGLMEEEYRFSAIANWVLKIARQLGNREELDLIAYALTQGADSAEGVEIPRFVVQTFRALPTAAGGLPVPNYVHGLLTGVRFDAGRPGFDQTSTDTFLKLWNEAFSWMRTDPAGLDAHVQQPIVRDHPVSVLEPACGSANDFRFLHAYGIADFLDYTGFDLCRKNVENARALFPAARFDEGNVFEIASQNKAFDLLFVHDLFEHLSPEGIQVAVAEVCRVTRWGLGVGFFNLDEIPEHVIRPIEEYHWNTLSMAQMKQLFAQHGFSGQVLHIGTLLRQRLGCEYTHNPNAYTLLLQPLPVPQAP
jgi:SAM-dependent methyltransferase